MVDNSSGGNTYGRGNGDHSVVIVMKVCSVTTRSIMCVRLHVWVCVLPDRVTAVEDGRQAFEGGDGGVGAATELRHLVRGKRRIDMLTYVFSG
jgi:hypothetical protein